MRQSHSHDIERSAEAKEEIARLLQECLMWKARIGLVPEDAAEGRIRDRRRFPSRRLDELEAERVALDREREAVDDELVILIAGSTRDERRHAIAEGASSAPEEHG